MSDSAGHRRQPPSPLVFAPETVLPSMSSSQTQKHGSGSNTVSMPFIKRHVTRRLKGAKQECDKELQRVTNAITAFFEERLRDMDQERDRDREARDRYHGTDTEDEMPLPREALMFQPNDVRSALPMDDASSDGGYEAEPEGNRSRQQSVTSSPSSLRRHNTLSKDKPLSSLPSSAAQATADGSHRKSTAGSNNLGASWGGGGAVSRRLSRSIHIPIRPTRSTHSSRSTSRSRSPLPIASHASFSDSGPSSSPNRRSSRILVDDPVDPIMAALYGIIGVATDVTEMSIAQLTSQPNVCTQLVQRVQSIGKTWDEHPDWQGRNWYVQVLLAIASLSRVVEWWEAEKQFWNFEDDDDDDQVEPFTFLLKPAEEAVPTPTTSTIKESDTKRQFSLSPENDSRLRMSRPPSQGKRSREDMPRRDSAPVLPSASATVTQPGPEAQRNPPKILDTTESARVLATERLRLQAEKAQNHNIVMELSLDGDHLIWLNYAWVVVVGADLEDSVGNKISEFLFPEDWNIFKDATQHLIADDSHTLELRFRLQVEPENEWLVQGIYYREMEGKGMLMIDHVDGRPSHTMWVIKPLGPPMIAQERAEYHIPGDDLLVDGGVARTTAGDLELLHQQQREVSPLPKVMSAINILCRICECEIPEWYFEKHNETCSEVHKFEADIGDCNESIVELRNTVRDLRQALDRSSISQLLEYRGMPIFTPIPSPSSSPLQMFRPPLMSKMQKMSVRKMQRRLLEQLEDILQVSYEVSIPALKDDEAKEPIERQRLLSPSSERKVLQIRNWSKPNTEDPALTRLVNDAEMLMRTKLDNVARMQNTIRYSEKVRQEWEEKYEEAMLQSAQEQEEEQGEDQDDGSATGDETGEEDRASITSEYAFDGRDSAPSGPTPSSSTILGPPTAGRSSNEMSSGGLAAPVPGLAMTTYPIVSMSLHTRSSTPSSVSSPLARATPIVANQDPEPLSLIETAKGILGMRKSTQNLEPKVMITPPISPSILPRDQPPSGAALRRLSTVLSPTAVGGPLSPRVPSVAPTARSTPTSIRDFDIIKPISKGAFGSVFLAKKKATGDYFAIKVLKKADMIAKNQITNVKAERMIMMKQAESPFVAKLYFTFQSKDNLYLVMEYLNGGDCAALIKTLGNLPEEWTKNYIAEVTLGLEYLHERGIVHRDMKPDNLLIDQHGHLKMTDFGLSRIGLLGRQTRDAQLSMDRLRPYSRYSPGSRPPSMDSAYLSSPLFSADVLSGSSYFNQRTSSASQFASSPHLPSGPPTDDMSESSGSDNLSGAFLRRLSRPGESPLQSFATDLTNDLRSHSNAAGNGTPPAEQKFVGTPDYLAPESILGIAGDDASVDWWALGVITYEFLYGIPPFHSETPEKVFENILSGHIDWHEDEEWYDVSPEARDFMVSLMTIDVSRRLGKNGAAEVKGHPFFAGIDWDKVTTNEAAFIPQVTDPESTDYFDLRGATPLLFHDDDPIPVGHTTASAIKASGVPTSAPVPVPGHESQNNDDFGNFSFKNLPVLKQANDDVIRKLRTDQMAPITHTLSEPSPVANRPHRRSVSQRIKRPPSVVTTTADNRPSNTNPPSPATSTSSIASSPSRSSMPPSTPGSATSHIRKPSELGAVERFKLNHMELDPSRRNSLPSRLRTASVSSSGDQASVSDHWPTSVTGFASAHGETSTPPSSVGSVDLRKTLESQDRAITCLLAEDNPITAKIIETLLTRLGCRCIVVSDGSEAISVAMGDIKFDCILMDLHMPVLDGESAAKYIKSTSNKNTSAPIIAVSAYSGQDSNAGGNVFAAFLAKPVQKADLITVMRQLGFKTSTQQDGGPSSTKVVATR